MFRSFGIKASTSGYVADAFGGLGIIGTELMQCALEKLNKLRANGCVVLGDPNYYGRFGFKAESNLVFPGVPQEYFQAISFTSHIPSGEVTYHPSFYNQG